MSHGFHCSHCGYYEVVHIEPISFAVGAGYIGSEQEAHVPLSGYRHSLMSCPGYKASAEELAFLRKEEEKQRQIGLWLREQGAVFLINGRFVPIPGGEDYGLALPPDFKPQQYQV